MVFACLRFNHTAYIICLFQMAAHDGDSQIETSWCFRSFKKKKRSSLALRPLSTMISRKSQSRRKLRHDVSQSVLSHSFAMTCQVLVGSIVTITILRKLTMERYKLFVVGYCITAALNGPESSKKARSVISAISSKRNATVGPVPPI